jgi:hypothetical protein
VLGKALCLGPRRFDSCPIRVDIDQFTTRRRSDNRPRPYSRLETDLELLDRCTEIHHKRGGTFRYCVHGDTNSHRAIFIAISRDEVESFAAGAYEVYRRVVWEAP